jgi:hypothetical protein
VTVGPKHRTSSWCILGAILIAGAVLSWKRVLQRSNPVPATNDTCKGPAAKAAGLFAFEATVRVPARSPCTSISKPSSLGVSMIAEISDLRMSVD